MASRVRFSVIAPSKFGENIYMTGNTDILGLWKPERALELFTTPETYPNWTVEVVLPSLLQLEYKYIKISHNPDGTISSCTWEEIEENRELKVSEEIIDVFDGLIGDLTSAKKPGRVSFPQISTATPSPAYTPLPKVLSATTQNNFSSLEKVSNQNLSQNQKIMLLMYNLPIRGSKDPNTKKWSFELLKTPMSQYLIEIAQSRKSEIYFIGILNDCDVSSEEEAEVRQELKKINCVPVFCQPEDIKNHYSFCKLILWPALHSVPSDFYAQNQSKELWDAYSHVCHSFAKEVISHSSGSDLIWTHGYQLWEVAPKIRKELPNSKIGMTSLIPFPSSEQFRAVTNCNDLLRGLLACNMVGFLVFDHARHFLSACHRQLGLVSQSQSGGMLCVKAENDRFVFVAVSHVTVEPLLFETEENSENEIIKNEENKKTQKVQTQPFVRGRSNSFNDDVGQPVQKAGAGAGWSVTVPELTFTAEELSALHRYILEQLPDLALHKNIRIVLGIDVLDYLGGIYNKFLAFEHLLSSYECWRENVVLLQVTIPRAGVPWSDSMKDYEQKLADVVSRINSKFKTEFHTPLVHIVSALSLSTRKMLYSLSDVLCITPLKDGLNVIPYEFVCYKYGQQSRANPNADQRRQTGSLVISEFTGVTKSLSGALRVNPFSIEITASEIDHALNMQIDECIARISKDNLHIQRHSVQKWTHSFIADLEESWGKAENLYHQAQNEKQQKSQLSKKACLEHFRLSYSQSSSRLILLDYDCCFPSDPSCGSLASNRAFDALQGLSKNSNNTVILICGSGRDSVDEIVSKYDQLQSIGFCAENGYCYRVGKQREWKSVNPMADLSWKTTASPILQTYAEHTDNSSLSETSSTFTFSFRDVDPALRQLQLKELLIHLESVFQRSRVRISSGNEIVELQTKGCCRSDFVECLLRERNYDFILTVGESSGFEDVFELLEKKAEIDHIYSCVFGQRKSKAKYFVKDTEELMDVIQSLD
eukprot:c19411_g2_i1.p1 GENE.c19411_g2_i1~~c19411_g2_i1.p1  ORF type:complete len:991 (+),score=413.04 c19411_g2_i1:104-3076(+)